MNEIELSSHNRKRNSSSLKGKKPKVVEYFSDDEQSAPAKPTESIKTRAKRLLEIRKTLPVYKVKDRLMSQIRNAKVCVLIGETGSGKSTQIPQFLMESSDKAIAVTQPRRVAAINLATRVAEEYGCPCGTQVGYSVRFQNKSSKNTKLKYLTDGMLLREMMINPELPQYSTIVLDEAHERTILTDLLMGFLKELSAKRDLRIIIMSATLDAEKFSHFFNNAPILFVEGKMFPVQRFYLPAPVDDIVDTIVKTCVQLNVSEPEGDILCFLPGQEEIDKAVSLLNRLAPDLPRESPLIVALPLYAALPSQRQVEIFQPVKRHQRKVILATNIAETSLTVPGIRYVVDSGLRKVKVWRHQLGLSTLLTAPVSKASATQRTGRAGREASGKSFRLYTEKDYASLPEQTEPEIVRSDVISPVLMLKKLGVDDLVNWSWLEHPGKEALMSALQNLYALKAIDNSGKITELGNQMAVLPLQPHLATVLISARQAGCLGPVIDIVSCLSVDNLVQNPTHEKREEVNDKRRQLCTLGTRYGDLFMLKEIFDYYNDISDTTERKRWCRDLELSYKGFKNVVRVKKQLQDYMRALFGEIEEEEKLDIESIIKCFLKGFIGNAAIGMPDRSYRTITTGQLVAIHPSSLLFGQKLDAIMYVEYVFTTRGYGRSVTRLNLEWLEEAAPSTWGTKVSVND